jgi:hypothetical protein
MAEDPNMDGLENIKDIRNLQKELDAIAMRHADKLKEIADIQKDINKMGNAGLYVAREELKYLEKKKQSVEERLSFAKRVTVEAKRHLELAKASRDLAANSKGLFDDIFRLVKGTGEMKAKFNVADMLAYQKSYYFSNLVKENVGQIGATSAMVLYAAKEIWKQFSLWDSVSTQFRNTMGLFHDDIADIKYDAFDVAKSMAEIGVTLGDIVKNTILLGAKYGGFYNVNRDVLKTLTAMETSLGVSVQNSSEVLKIMAAVSGNTMQSNKNALLFTKALTTAAGVPLDDVMKDVASLSGEALTMVSRMPSEIMKTAVEARRLGTTIGDMARGAKSLLQFDSSISKEMEASVLLGHSINLQQARELAYRRDLKGYMMEINKIAGSTDFQALDPFQQQAVAEALGQSVDSLLSMAQSQREIQAALNSNEPKVKAMAQEYQKLVNLNQKNADLTAKSVETSLMTKNNQEHMTAISQKWNKLMMELGRVFLPVIDKVLGFVVDHFNVIVGVVGAVYVGWKLLNGGFQKTVTFISNIAKALGGVWGTFGKVLNFAGRLIIPLMFAWNIFQEIKKILNDPALMGTKGFFAFNGKLILRAIGAIVRALWTTFNDLFFGLPGLIIKGLASAGDAIFGAIISPFKTAWEWLGKTFLGNSPSQLGLSIVKGILSVSQMITDALMLPFRMFMSWASKLPIIGNVMNKLGVSSVQAQASNTPSVSTLTPTPTTINAAGQSKQIAAAEKTQEALDLMTDTTGQAIVRKLDELMTALKNGAIAVNMDSQLVSATIARQTDFRGGYGVNKV